MKKLLIAAMALMIFPTVGLRYDMKIPLQRAHASFRTDFTGRTHAPEREAVLLTTHAEFSGYLSDPMRFFDGRFGFYEEYEGNNGAFFGKSDLVAVIVWGECTHAECTRKEGIWQVRLLPLAPSSAPALYFLPVPKGGTGVCLNA